MEVGIEIEEGNRALNQASREKERRGKTFFQHSFLTAPFQNRSPIYKYKCRIAIGELGSNHDYFVWWAYLYVIYNGQMACPGAVMSL
jgi:hypothetical protein